MGSRDSAPAEQDASLARHVRDP
ncbi:unnamed protein product [Linum tenue]|uniref:Uncharacterized protein n=1 Tax=Linum tenue TaxID=586396 RepID=A0AAV0MSA3_9ROSI|nr:unnamed protein product [Linum tenue]CAI0547306.1 unnamed protein product [Linum tenue]